MLIILYDSPFSIEAVRGEGRAMSELMYSGIELAILGMGTVYVFLVVLVLATGWMSRAILAMSPVQVPPSSSARTPSAVTDRRLLAAIGAAVQRYREDHER